MSKRYHVATDVGGTFTDVVCYELDQDENVITKIVTNKLPTTPPNFEEAVMRGIEKAGVSIKDVDEFLAHGTTVVINAITERKGVKVGLITTRGFRDVLEIARGDRLDMFNIRYKKPPPFVPRYLRKEISERTTYRGDIQSPVALEELPSIIDSLRKEQVEAVAICLLHAYANPSNEKVILEAVKEVWPEVYVVASHQILREWREYERTNTTVLSAYIQPIVSNYLDRFKQELVDRGFSGSAYIMQSNGGIDTFESGHTKAITMIESGPASGILGAAVLGEQIGERNIIALDVGGTTAKCSLIYNGKVQVITEYHLERNKYSSGYPLLVPVVDLVEIGNGGGSIAWVDGQEKLHVGPQSAGANPGPVAYGKGGCEPTTTDAHLLTGRIGPTSFGGGDAEPDMENVKSAFSRLGEKLDLEATDAALGVIRVANNNMANTLRLVSIGRGYDPREFVLVAFGGGGGLHAAELASELNIPKVIIPAHASVFSAWGMLMSDLRRDWIFTRQMVVNEIAINEIRKTFDEMERRAFNSFRADGYTDVRYEYRAEMRYSDQEHTTKVLLPEDVIKAHQVDAFLSIFKEAYEREYSYRLDKSVELVTYHLTAFARVGQTHGSLPPIADMQRGSRVCPNKTERNMLLQRGQGHVATKVPVYEYSCLDVDSELLGPVIIEEGKTSTTVILEGETVRKDDHGNLHIDVFKN